MDDERGVVGEYAFALVMAGSPVLRVAAPAPALWLGSARLRMRPQVTVALTALGSNVNVLRSRTGSPSAIGELRLNGAELLVART